MLSEREREREIEREIERERERERGRERENGGSNRKRVLQNNFTQADKSVLLAIKLKSRQRKGKATARRVVY